MRKLAWLVLVTACVSGIEGAGYEAGNDFDNEDSIIAVAGGGQVTFAETADYVDWKNDKGTFRIYKVCKGPIPGAQYIGHDGSVGPGYVATAWNKNGQIVLDDTHVPAHIGPNSGATGLGMFGIHLVRRPVGAGAGFTTRDLGPDGKPKAGGKDYTNQIAGRWCNANRRPDDYAGYRGYGVRSFSTPGSGNYVAPSVTDNVGQFTIDVAIGDAYSDLVGVKYTYRITSSAITAWVRVTNLCSNGMCDVAAAGGEAFVKEPKLIVGVNPADPDAVDITQMNIFEDTGHTATGTDKRNYWMNTCSRSPGAPDIKDSKLCVWGGMDPTKSTGQCNDADRRRVRFWNPELTCAEDPSCLVIAARSADQELGPTYPWQSAHGLDLWAMRNVSESRESAAAADSLADGYLNANNCRVNSASVSNRRWEMAGYQKTASCGYKTAVASFHAWEGGTGTYDCEPLYYRMGNSPANARESYVTALSFGFGAAPLP
jgi:hypothetical protein